MTLKTEKFLLYSGFLCRLTNGCWKNTPAETYQGLEAGRASRYYPYFCQLASRMDEMMTDDEDEEDEIPVDTWDRPDMTDE